MSRQRHDGVNAHAFVGKRCNEFAPEAVARTIFQANFPEQSAEETGNAVSCEPANRIFLGGP